MPFMDGRGLARRLRGILPSIGLLFISGHPGRGNDPEEEGRFLAKPFSEAELAKAVIARLGSDARYGEASGACAAFARARESRIAGLACERSPRTRARARACRVAIRPPSSPPRRGRAGFAGTSTAKRIDDPRRPGREHDRAVREIGRFLDVVGDADDGPPLFAQESQEDVHELELHPEVHRLEGLVHEEDVRGIGEGPSEREALPHAARKLARPQVSGLASPAAARNRSTRASASSPMARRPRARRRHSPCNRCQGRSRGSWKA